MENEVLSLCPSIPIDFSFDQQADINIFASFTVPLFKDLQEFHHPNSR